MLYPNPLSLFCAILLCLPLAILFTITTPSTTTIPSTTTTIPTTPLTTNHSSLNPVIPVLSTLIPILTTQQKPPKGQNKTTVSVSAAATTTTTTTSRTRPPPLQLIEDDDDDDPLFQLAAQVKPNPLPITEPKKLAFMFLTTTPLPFAPLWELYFNTTPKNLYNIYVHADPSFNYTPPFHGVFTDRVILSRPTRRYSPTLISAARRLLSNALLHDPSNYMFVLLSPSCIPLRSFNFTYKTLIKSKKSFIEILGNEVGAFDRWAARGEDVMLPEVKFKDFRIGSQFFSLTRRHARIVVRDRRLWCKFKLPCLQRHTCYPEEHYFATLLNMVDPRECVPATLTHVDWRGRHDGHPRTYRASEIIPQLIWALRNDTPRYGDDQINGSDLSVTKRHDPFLFARKFSRGSIGPLMSMANDVIFKD